MMTDEEQTKYRNYLASKGFSPEEADRYMQEAGISSAPKVIQEMHPDISEKERLIVKNFANSPQSAVAYLQKEHPNDEIKYENGQYLIRSPSEENYRVVDPNTGFFSKDMLRDAGDLGYDIGSGALQGLAEAGGAVGGAMLGGAGAIPGAMAAGAASSAGLEAARQKLGEYLGIPQTVNGTDVAISGAAGAIAPLIMGAGKASGLASKGYNFAKESALPYVGEKVSGVPRNAIKTLIKRFPEIEQANKTGITDKVAAAQQRIVSTLQDLKQQRGQALADAINNAGGSVDMTKVKGPFQDHIASLEAMYNEVPNQTNLDKLNEAKSVYSNLFGTVNHEGAPTGEVGDQISPKAAFNMQDDLADYGDLSRLSQGTKDRYATNATRADKVLADKAAQSYSAVNDELDNLTNGTSGDLKTEYKQILDDRKYLHPLFKDNDTAYRTLSNLDTTRKKILQERLSEIDKKYGLNLRPDADLVEAYSFFGKPALNALSSGGTTSTSRTIPLALAGGSLGSLAGYKAGGGYAGATAGGALGTIAGAALGSPAALRTGIKLLLNSEIGANAARNAAKKGIDYLPYSPVMQQAIPLGVGTQLSQVPAQGLVNSGQNIWQGLFASPQQ